MKAAVSGGFVSNAVQNDLVWSALDRGILRFTRYVERKRILGAMSGFRPEPESRVRAAAKSLLSRVIQYDLVWNALDRTVLRVARHAERERALGSALRLVSGQKKGIVSRPNPAISALLRESVVKHGAFAGMKYPALEAVGSAFLPKLLGSYEAELAPVVDKICGEGYTEIADVGCAEGYYAVGLAMRMPAVKVYAYDNDEKAVSLCLQMARLNGVEKRVSVGSFCDIEVLKAIPFTRKGLVISDCEGYEKDLFTEEAVQVLARHDLLIELHDFVDSSISAGIRKHFEKSHRIQVIKSIEDMEKAKTCRCPELAGLDLETKKNILGERRPVIMEWFFMQSRLTPSGVPQTGALA